MEMHRLFYILLCALIFTNALPEIGHSNEVGQLGNVFSFTKSAYKNTKINIYITCVEKLQASLSFKLLYTECIETFYYANLTGKNMLLPTTVFTSHVHQQLMTTDKQFTCDPSIPKSINLTTQDDGIYMLLLSVDCHTSKDCKHNNKVRLIVDMRTDSGYLSAIEYPLRTFYGLLTLFYVSLSLLWIVFTICHWKYLLRIQYYITLVIVIGVIEALTSFALYESVNRTGQVIISSVVFNTLISCCKRTLARYLVMIVCVGYGITKSRLGTAYRRLIVICCIYFVCSLIENGMLAYHYRFYKSTLIMITSLPLALLEMVILWWSFSYLLTTLRETRMRRNKVKHRLYRIFSCLLIAIALVSLLCMLLSMYLLHWNQCTKAWRYIWVDETIWQVLFFIILIAIVILWRPSSTNKVYARSAFLDPDVDPPAEDMEELLMDAIVTGINDSDFQNSDKSKEQSFVSEDEALRWAEENIPSSNALNEGTGDKKSAFRQPMKVD